MPITRTTNIRLVKYLAVIVASLLILLFIIWRSLNYVRGPDITIFEPMNGASTSSSTITLKGQVARVNNLSVNGNIVPVDQQGLFTWSLVIFPGVNIITIDAKDRFLRNTRETILLVGTSPRE